jgi:hypothetical protein
MLGGSDGDVGLASHRVAEGDQQLDEQRNLVGFRLGLYGVDDFTGQCVKSVITRGLRPRACFDGL